MSILLSSEIMSAITKELRAAQESVQIITAYCKESAIRQLNSHIPSSVQEKKIMIRFRLDDIVKGSTDFSVLEFCRSHGWKVFLRFDLHAKTYVVDGKRCFVGSANVTNSGLELGQKGNIEIGTLIDLNKNDIHQIESLYSDAVFVNEDIYRKLNEQYKNTNFKETKKQYLWDDEIEKLFNPRISTLFSYELPDKAKYSAGDYIDFLDITYSGDILVLKNSFRWSNTYLWLMNTLRENNGCLYFGAITEMLHNALVSDPKPYRKDVKQLLSNLLNLIEDLKMDEIIIDKPSFSQRVRLKKNGD